MDRKPLTIVTWNACSVRAKTIELADFTRKHNVDVGLLTETHLKSGDNFYLPDYVTIRLDRINSRGGGVAILVKRGIKYNTLPHVRTSVIEALSVEVESSTGFIQFTAAYCPHQCVNSNGLAAKFRNDLTAITRTSSRFIIGGDLNARHEAWRNYQQNQNGRLLFDHSQHGLYTIQFSDEPTFISPAGNPSTLDLFLSNIELSKPEGLNELSSDHRPVKAEVGVNVVHAPRQLRKDYHHVDWAAFARTVDNNIEEHPLLDTAEDIDRALEALYRAINTADETCVRRVPVRGKFIDIDSHTQLLIRLRNIRRRQFQRTGDLDKKREVVDLNKLISSRMNSLRNENFGRVVQNLDDRSRPFWKIAKVLKTHPKPVPPLKVGNDILITPFEKADAIGKHIASSHLLGSNIQSSLERQVIDCVQNVDESPCTMPLQNRITAEQVCSAVKYTKNMKAPGFDGIYNIILKKLNNKTLTFLSHILNKCLELHYFPSIWKVAKIIPIRKPGKDPTVPSSYRPISLLSALSKLFEKLILNRLLNFVEEQNILLPEQFGFRKEHSTTHQLVRVMNTIKRNRAVSKSTAMAFLDIEKAFDNVWHDGLVYKLCRLNFPNYLIKIIRNYLQQRSFRVSLQGCLSNTFIIPAGVPQGSLLGPLLYSIYTSDIPRLGSDSEFFLFADDTAVAVKGRMPREITNKLQRCLDTLVEYASKWKIKINDAKTQTIMFLHRQSPRLKPPIDCTIVMNGSTVQWSTNVVYLGLLFDEKLLFRLHVEKILLKCSALVKNLYPLICRRSRLSRVNKLAVYKQIISPAIFYAAPVWESCAKTHRNKIQIAQNRTLRMILNLPFSTRISILHTEANIIKIESKITEIKEKFVNKCNLSEHALIRALYIVG